MKRRYEQTVGGGWVAVLIPETPEDQAEIDAMEIRGEVNDYACFKARHNIIYTGAELTRPYPRYISLTGLQSRTCGERGP